MTLFIALVIVALCTGTVVLVDDAVVAGFDVFERVLKLLPEPEPWVPPPEPIEEEEDDNGQPVFQDLLKQIPKPAPKPTPYFFAPRGQSEDRNWPPGFYRDPEPEASETPDPQPEQPLLTIPQPDVDCEPAVFLVDQMKWTCLDDDMDAEDDAPATIEPPLDICDFRYCPYRFHPPIIGVF